MIKLTVEGVVYEFDGDHLLLAEAREIKTFTGMSVAKWSAGIDEGDVDAIQVLIYLAKKRAKESLRFSDLESVDYADIDLELVGDEPEPGDGGERLAEAVEDVRGAVAAAVDPTPTGGAGTIPTPGTTGISPPSPTTSSTPPQTSTP